MAEELLHQNPRIELGFPSSSFSRRQPTNYSSATAVASATASAKSMPNDAATKPTSSLIVDRFHDLLKERKDELFRSISRGVGGGVVVPPLSTEEIVRLYELVLSELTVNSKPIITDLTIIAGELREEHGEGIADAVCARILEVQADLKLPALYLLDSIVKNIGREYVQYFSSRLPEVFCEAFSQVPPNMYRAMRHLFGTWSTVFPSSVLRKIEAELQFSPSQNHHSAVSVSARASESPRPSHGIHVNPKYLEARLQFDSSSANSNIQHARSTSTSKIYGQKSAAGYDGYNSDQGDGPVPVVEAERLTAYGGHTSLVMGAEKLFPSAVGPSMPLSPASDDFGASRSPGRIAETSRGPSYGLGRLTGRDVEVGDWPKRRGFDNPPPYGLSNGYIRDRPRALIDAYGQDDGQRTSNGRPHRVDPLTVNGVDKKMVARPWQNSEEEEFVWEDMSPTLADRRNNDPTTSSGSFPARHSLDIHSSTSLDPNFRSSNWTTAAPRSKFNHSLNIAETISLAAHGPGLQGMRNQGSLFADSHHPQETWNLKPKFQDPSPNHLPNGRIGRNSFTFSPGSPSTTAGDIMPLNIDHISHPDSRLTRLHNAGKRPVSAAFDSINAGSSVIPPSTMLRHPVSHESHLPSYPPTYVPQKELAGQFDFVHTNNKYTNQAYQLFHDDEVMNSLAVRPSHVPNQQVGLISLHQPAQLPVQQQMLAASEAQRTAFSSSHAPSSMLPMSHGYPMVGHAPSSSTIMINPIPGQRPPMPPQNISFQIHGVRPPPSHLGLHPASSQSLPLPLGSGHIPQQASGNAFSGLISSLVSQGLISFTKEAPGQDSLGFEFDQDLLKARHESVIQALYADLPRQCRTCGLRFKTQEEHSKHMDWHVTKNRLSRNRKQNLSRKWFVSVSMWLTGTEALGVDSAPGFLPTETAVEKKDDDEMAVPADEDQSTCALCGEPFEDFYSDETEEWMYKGAVYLNAPVGSMASMDRSQLGPIVHAKCRSESNVVPPKDNGQEEGGTFEEGSERKRMRT